MATTENGRGGIDNSGGEPPVALGRHDAHHGGFIFKPGEGYWVRVLTAVALNVLFLAAAGWAFRNLSAVNLPTDHWVATVSGAEKIPAASAVELLSTKFSVDSSPVVIGTGTAGAGSTGPLGETLLRLDAVQMKSNHLPSEAQTIKAGAATAVLGAINAVPIFPIIYLQGAVAGLLALTGVFLALRFAGRKPESVEFLIATDSEMRKVNWSTRREVMGSTYVVIAACVLIAGSLFLIDFAFSHFFTAIKILKVK